MTRIAFIFAVSCLIADCSTSSTDQDEPVAVAREALDVTKPSMLTKKQGGVANLHTEGSPTQAGTRQGDTFYYYDGVSTFYDGTFPNNGQDTRLVSDEATLRAFRLGYGFEGREKVAYYYNRGDLGIGREMHCVDNFLTNGTTIACYVKNFAAGDDGSEFTFGMSSNIAFKNMDANHPFATVAMAYRDLAQDPNKVYFSVYDKPDAIGNEKLLYSAALDRVGILYATGKNTTSTPGVNFNNHIPTNCLACHGGTYDSTDRVRGALFLPFDLDRFEYQNIPGRTRDDQELTFRRLNEMVWKVAVRSGFENVNHSVRNRIDFWYNNPSSVHDVDSKTVLFPNKFDSTNRLPPGWLNPNLYSVVQPVCGSCHLTNAVPFDTEAAFNDRADGPVGIGAIADLCNYQMPHSLQALREFWLSSRPAQLQSYWRSIYQPARADQLAACGPGNVATLDPQFITAIMP